MLWAFMGTLNLIRLTYQDFKNNMEIDDRYNYLMTGATIMLLQIYRRGILLILAFIGLIIVMTFLLKKLEAIGAGDISSISWIFLGFMIINPAMLIIFLTAYAFFTLIYFGIRALIFKHQNISNKTHTPFFIILLISFFITGIAFRLY